MRNKILSSLLLKIMSLSKPQYSEPRYLNTAEIEDIVSVIPNVRAATREASEKATSQIKAKHRIQLREYKVCVEKIPELKGTILSMFYRSRLEPGEPVGLTAGEGIGGPTTQMTLSNFHNAGSKNVGSGVDIIRELLNITLVRKVENSTIHFKNKNMTFEEVMEAKRSLIGINVNDLIKRIDNKEILDEKGQYIPHERRGLWYKSYLTITNKTFQESRHYLHLVIDRTKMYAHKITLTDIVNCLENEESGLIFCIPSPSSVFFNKNEESFIDVYVDEGRVMAAIQAKSGNKTISGIDHSNMSLFLFQLFLVPSFKSFVVNGIPRIKQISPEVIRTMSIVRSTQKFMRDIDIKEDLAKYKNIDTEEQHEQREFMLKNKWSMWIDPIYLRINGIPLSKLTTLLNLCNIYIEEYPHDPDPNPEMEDRYVLPRHRPVQMDPLKRDEPMRYIVRMTEFHRNKNRNIPSPDSYINNLLDIESEKEKKSVKDIKDRHKAEYIEIYKGLPESDRPRYVGIYVKPEVSNLSRAGNYVYAYSDGSNLKGLLTHPLIDKRRTICNNPNEIAAVLGIEAARNFIIRDFYETIINHDAYVSPRHIAVIADFMTNQMLMSITSKGISRQNRGAFSDASFEHAIEAFVKSATFGKWEEVTATSTCIFMGTRCGFGTGIMKLSLNEKNLETIKHEANIQTDLENKMKSDASNISDFNLANFTLQIGDSLDTSVSLDVVSETGVVTAPIPSAVANTLITDVRMQAFPEQPIGLPIVRSVADKGPVPQVTPSLDAPAWLQGLL